MFISKEEKKYLFDTIREFESRIKDIESSKFLRVSAVEAAAKAELESKPPSIEEPLVLKKRRTRSPSITPRGSLSAYVYPFIDRLIVGQSIEVPPIGNFTAARIQSSAGAYVNAKGANKQIITRHMENGNLYILRIS